MIIDRVNMMLNMNNNVSHMIDDFFDIFYVIILVIFSIYLKICFNNQNFYLKNPQNLFEKANLQLNFYYNEKLPKPTQKT